MATSSTPGGATGAKIVTAESVTIGHPDKLCDQISDAIVDALLARDPYARCGVEAAASSDEVWVFGQVESADPLSATEIVAIARRVIREIGYESAAEGIDPDTCTIRVTIDPQSRDIAQGVDLGGGELGAGDQGIIYGLATNETPELLPAPVVWSRRLTVALRKAREDGSIPWLRPDGKAQVSVRVVDGRVEGIDAVVLSAQHRASASDAEIRRELESLVRRELGDLLLPDAKLHINPTGRFVVGGPLADSGLTGRKIAVDTYGGIGRHGGGAFSGKDATKVDRSAAYAVRHAAVNVVAAGLADRCEISVAYAIGVVHPVAFSVDTFGTGSIPDERIAELVRTNFDFSPAGMIERFGLRRPIYAATAREGHFGHAEFPWERRDVAPALRAAVGR